MQRTDIYTQLQDLIDLRKRHVDLLENESNKLKRSVGIDAKPTNNLDADPKSMSRLGVEAKLTSKLKELNATYHELDAVDRAKVDKLLNDNELHELLNILKEKKSGSSFARKLGTININEKQFIDQLNTLRGIEPAASNSDEYADMDTGTVRMNEGATIKNSEIQQALERASEHIDKTGYVANAMVSPLDEGLPRDPLSIIIEAFEVLKKSKTNKKKEARRSIDGRIWGGFKNKYVDSLTEQVALLTIHYGAFNELARQRPVIARRLADIREILQKPAVDQIQQVAKAEAIIAIIDDILVDQLKTLQAAQQATLRKSK